MTTTLHHKSSSTADMCRMEVAYGTEGGTVNDTDVIMKEIEERTAFSCV